METNLDSTTTQTVGGLVASNNTAARAGLFTGSSLVDLGDAALISVNVLNLDSNSDTSVVSSATGDVPFNLAGGNKADAETDATVATTTHISGVGTVINATDRVSINADAVRAFTSARAKATTTGLSGNMFSTADNNRVIDADVITDAGSTINTARLDIVAFVPHLGLTPDQLALLTAVNITVQDDSYFRLAETNAQTATEYVSQGIETIGNAIIDAACGCSDAIQSLRRELSPKVSARFWELRTRRSIWESIRSTIRSISIPPSIWVRERLDRLSRSMRRDESHVWKGLRCQMASDL